MVTDSNGLVPVAKLRTLTVEFKRTAAEIVKLPVEGVDCQERSRGLL